MSLILRQTGLQPLGQYPLGDRVTTDDLAGKVGVFFLEFGSPDVEGTYGYEENRSSRTVVDLATATTPKPYLLLDDGITGYGTTFGNYIQRDNVTGTVLGPATQRGSGKVTCWASAGLYALPYGEWGNEALFAPTANTMRPGDVIGVDNNGDLTPQVNATGTAGDRYDELTNAERAFVLGYFVEWSTEGSLVSTNPGQVGNADQPYLVFLKAD
jgi:hypothetical protein